MTIRILDTSYIIDFVKPYTDSINFFTDLSKKVTDKLNIENDKVNDWEILISFIYNNVDSVLIYQKGKTYSTEKYKEITVHLPIPNNNEVKWGVEEKSYVQQNKHHLDSLKKNFDVLEVDFSPFDSMEDYLLDTIRRTLKHIFIIGVKLNGVIIKSNNIGV